MTLSTTASLDDFGRTRASNGGIVETAIPRTGAVSWAAIAAGGVAAGGAVGSSRLSPGNDSGAMGYFIDSLFRRDTTATTAAATADSAPGADAMERTSARDTAEVGRIFINAGRAQAMPPDDVRYVGQVVAQRTGLSQQDAEKRVADVHARAQAQLRAAETAARDAADKARKASAYGALWLFVSLLGGAFVASLSATFGGRRRDA